MERFLHRLSKSSHVDGVLLKGALLLKTIGIPRARPTMDIDLLRRGKADRESLIALVRECALVVDETDGVTFDPNSIVASEISKDSDYEGTRIVLRGRMDNVRLSVQIDFGVGDAVSPTPRVIAYPTLFGEGPIRLRAYPVEAAISEKFEAMVNRGLRNSRMKDFYDIWACLSHLQFDGETLKGSIAATFERRATPIPTESPVAMTAAFFASSVHQTQWRAFTRKIFEPDLSDSFPDIVGKIEEFLMPPAGAAARSVKFPSYWKPNGPWSSAA
jgi:hypothetical protein